MANPCTISSDPDCFLDHRTLYRHAHTHLAASSKKGTVEFLDAAGLSALCSRELLFRCCGSPERPSSIEMEPVRLDIEPGLLDLCHWPGLDGKNPGASLKGATKDMYRLGKNDVLLRTAHPQKSGYTCYEATHETSPAGRCGQETRSGSNNSRNRACSLHQGSRHTSEESSRATTTSRPELPAGSHPGSRPSVCLQGGRTRTQKGTSIVNQHHTIRLSSWARLVGLALLLGVGLLASLGLASRTAHAQPAMTSTVSTCDDATLP